MAAKGVGSSSGNERGVWSRELTNDGIDSGRPPYNYCQEDEDVDGVSQLRALVLRVREKEALLSESNETVLQKTALEEVVPKEVQTDNVSLYRVKRSMDESACPENPQEGIPSQSAGPPLKKQKQEDS